MGQPPAAPPTGVEAELPPQKCRSPAFLPHPDLRPPELTSHHAFDPVFISHHSKPTEASSPGPIYHLLWSYSLPPTVPLDFRVQYQPNSPAPAGAPLPQDTAPLQPLPGPQSTASEAGRALRACHTPPLDLSLLVP